MLALVYSSGGRSHQLFILSETERTPVIFVITPSHGLGVIVYYSDKNR